MTLTYEMIDNMFRCYELEVKIRTTPTTKQIVDSIIEAVKVFKELYPEMEKECMKSQ
jgi:hypothetical protein